MVVGWALAVVLMTASLWNMLTAVVYMMRGWKWRPVFPAAARSVGNIRAVCLILFSFALAIVIVPELIGAPGAIVLKLKLAAAVLFLAYVACAVRGPSAPRGTGNGFVSYWDYDFLAIFRQHRHHDHNELPTYSCTFTNPFAGPAARRCHGRGRCAWTAGHCCIRRAASRAGSGIGLPTTGTCTRNVCDAVYVVPGGF